MRISLIVAMSDGRVIGADNALPWHLPADLKRFKGLTMGKPVLMGRKTYQSIGRALPGRTNIVLTRDPGFGAEGCLVVGSVEEALKAAGECEELMVIGGASVYRELLPRAGRLYITQVKGSPPGDTFFPELDACDWREVSREHHPADAGNPHPHDFVVMDRA